MTNLKGGNMSLKVTSTQKAKHLYIISPAGTLDSNTYTIFQEEIDKVLTEAPTMIVFDMKDLDYLSSAGVRVILKTRDVLKNNDGKITFMNLQPQIKKVFEIINAIPSMKIFTSIEELDEYLDVMQKKIKEEGA
jgi:anti-anti-sigma factor